MSNWSNTQLTDKGRALDAKVTAGLATLTFTKMKLGSGTESSAAIPTMTDLTVPELVLGISSCAVSQSDSTICEVIAIASSDNVSTSFVIRELGIFATDPDDGEILYAVMLDRNPDTMPNHNVASPVTVTYQVNIMSANAASISAVIDPAGLVSVSALTAAINTHDSSAASHPLTIDDTVAPTSDSAPMATILNNVANMLKQVKGDNDWKTAPGISLAAILGDFATNLSVTTDPDTGVFTCASLGITGLMARNGYICLGKLFGGLILQWGYSSGTSASTLSLVLPVSYRIAYTAVAAQNAGTSGTASAYFRVTTTNKTTLVVNSNYTAVFAFNWVTIGA